MLHGTPKFEYSRITSHVFLGTDMCCTLHFKQELLRKGVTADISLREKHLDTPFGVKYFLWLPAKDHYAPSLKQLMAGAVFIDMMVRQNVKVYVHCKAGHGRSPTLVAAYFILGGMTAREAIATIRRKRHGIHPTAVQFKALEKFNAVVKQKIVKSELSAYF